MCGYVVQKVNFCGGDFLYGGVVCYVVNYEGCFGELLVWYLDVIGGGDFIDVLMFGDCCEVYVFVYVIVQKVGMCVYVFEEGYVWLYWLMLECYGVNGCFLLFWDLGWYCD